MLIKNLAQEGHFGQMADSLSLSIKTVSTHKSNILDKMTLGGQVELVRYAIEHKLLDGAR